MIRLPWLSFLWGTRQPARPGPRRASGLPLHLEVLEERTLLSSTLQAITLANAALPTASAAAGISNNASVSSDGRFVAFESTADNLVTGQQSAAITDNL